MTLSNDKICIRDKTLEFEMIIKEQLKKYYK